jgi:hypothetical protein
MKKRAAALMAAGFILILIVSSFAVTAAQDRNVKTGGSAGQVSTDTVRMVGVCYYDNGGTPHQIELSEVDPGPAYEVWGDIVVKATGYWSGSGGMGLVEIYNPLTNENYATKLIPKGKTVSAVTPAAIFVNTGDSYELAALVRGADPGIPPKVYYFQFINAP